ncbi:GNAT family N-acetyltransferase [Rouxiella sp. WC2420]|uniref:GNAT family N-acetyltransferase n=1 Tax=Rouxiella sp. WC2420 TaxID=3234145 RepID=A0AB39VNI5_9GAMM
MELIVSDISSIKEEQTIIDNLWEYNSHVTPVDIKPLRVVAKNESGDIVGGLLSRTWWGGLDIQYLWVAQENRKMGLGKRLMQTAQLEAIGRGCHMAYVDTFSFQALGFYQRLGFRQYGELAEFAHQHTRFYLSKRLSLDNLSELLVQWHDENDK